MAFLPEGYRVPQKSNYTKFEQGETIIRILEEPLLGWELWVNGKPKRIPMDGSFSMSDMNNADINKFTNLRSEPRHFWAMVVWNYDLKMIQICELTRRDQMNPIKALSRSKAWGSPLEYDLSITKDGEKQDMTFSIQPCPKEKLSKEIVEKYKMAKIDINKLLSGEDPFNKEGEIKTVEEMSSDDVANSIPF